METALRLLEYPDFVEVPFMQDLHVRALYDGLKGHGSRANFMEEFLVGLGVKKPVGLTIPGRARVYACLLYTSLCRQQLCKGQLFQYYQDRCR